MLAWYQTLEQACSSTIGLRGTLLLPVDSPRRSPSCKHRQRAAAASLLLPCICGHGMMCCQHSLCAHATSAPCMHTLALLTCPRVAARHAPQSGFCTLARRHLLSCALPATPCPVPLSAASSQVQHVVQHAAAVAALRATRGKDDLPTQYIILGSSELSAPPPQLQLCVPAVQARLGGLS